MKSLNVTFTTVFVATLRIYGVMGCCKDEAYRKTMLLANKICNKNQFPEIFYGYGENIL